MSPLKKIGTNLAYKTTTELIGRVLAFIFYMMIARWLGEVAFGTFSLVYSVLAVLVFLVDPGLNLLLIRQGSRDSNFIDSALGGMLGLKVTLSFLMTTIALVYAVLGGFETTVIWIFFLLGIQMAGFAITEYASAIFQSQEKMQYETMIMGASKIAVTGLASLCLALGAGLLFAVAVMTLVQSVAAICSLSFTFRQGYTSILPSFAVPQWANLLRQAFPLAAITFFVIAFYRIDIAIAPFLGMGLAEIGWYSSGVKLLDVALAVPTLGMAAAFPTLSRLAAQDRSRFLRLSNLLLLAIALSGLTCALLVFFFAKNIVLTIFGAGFVPAVSSTSLLGIASFFVFTRHGLLTLMILDGKSDSAVKIVAIGLAVNITCNLMLIPTNGAIGAAWSKVITDLSVCIAGSWVWFSIVRRGVKLDE
ncbi:MAG TPA: oligosaccharide flippase family protein [Nitrospinota bacterium]|nr:oligosaccharide flippase family protein [Nitrospinota bacterium]